MSHPTTLDCCCCCCCCRSIAFRQLVVITACILLVRFALNNVLRFLARWSSSPVQWDKSKLYYVMKEVSLGWGGGGLRCVEVC